MFIKAVAATVRDYLAPVIISKCFIGNVGAWVIDLLDAMVCVPVKIGSMPVLVFLPPYIIRIVWIAIVDVDVRGLVGLEHARDSARHGLIGIGRLMVLRIRDGPDKVVAVIREMSCDGRIILEIGIAYEPTV